MNAPARALDPRVAEAIERYGAAKLRRGMAISDAIHDEIDASKAALVAAITDAIAEAATGRCSTRSTHTGARCTRKPRHRGNHDFPWVLP